MIHIVNNFSQGFQKCFISITENVSTVEQVERRQDTEVSRVHYFSLLCGPFVAIFWASFYFLIPCSNVLVHPEKWYEFHILVSFTMVPALGWIVMTHIEAFANFPISNKLKTFGINLIISLIVYALGVFIFYTIWVDIYQLPQPMPFSYLIIGNIVAAACTIAIWLRYCSILLTFIKEYYTPNDFSTLDYHPHFGNKVNH